LILVWELDIGLLQKYNFKNCVIR